MAGDILDRFNPKIAKLVKSLYNTDSIGLQGGRVKIIEQKSGYVVNMCMYMLAFQRKCSSGEYVIELRVFVCFQM